MENQSISSGLLTGSAIVSTGPSELIGVLVLTNAANDVTCIVHDGASATNRVLSKFTVLGEALFGGIGYSKRPVYAPNGIYVELTGAGGNCIIYYGKL